MTEKLTKIISGIFAVAWTIIILSEYWRNNPFYGKALEYFQYADLLVVFLLIGAVLSWGISKVKKKPIKFINGLTVFVGLLILDVITMMLFYGKVASINLDGSGLFSHLGHLTGVAAAVFLVYLAVRAIGQILTTIFPIKIATTDLPVIQVALGIMTLTGLLFLLGIFGLLTNWVVIPILLILLLADPHGTFQVIKKTLFQPLKITKNLNVFGVFSFLFLGVFLLFDFVQILRPFPAGTDAINVYVNLPKVIGESGELVSGHLPYNWSLFMSLGTVVFDRIDVTLALSFFGGFMAFRVLYQLSRKWLSINQSAFCLLLFGSLPMTNYFLFQDMKIDLGLLFLTLCVLLLFYNLLVPPKGHSAKQSSTDKTIPLKNRNRTKQKNKKPLFGLQSARWLIAGKNFFSARIPSVLKENRILVVMGLLGGFAFGVKLSFLFFFMALVAGIWYSENGIFAFTAAFFLIFGTVFLLKLDAQPHLRAFHKNVDVLQWALMVIGMGLTAYLFFTKRKSTINMLKKTLILGLVFLLPILPWFGKNISETNKISIYRILNGKKAAPELDMKELKKLVE